MARFKFGSWATIGLATIASLLVFCWPLFIGAGRVDQSSLAQGIFMLLMPVLVGLILVETSRGAIDSRRLAVLGVLSALNAVIRLLGAGVSGIETAFFIIILGGYVFGASFGFILGASSLLLSALLGAGVGPWLPFQMMAAGMVGIGAGLISNLTRRKHLELVVLVSYGLISSFGYGALMTMWNWPFLAGTGSSISYLAGAPLVENLIRFLRYELLTGGLIWDAGRALTTTILTLLTAPALLATLRRAANRAGFSKTQKIGRVTTD